MCVVQTPYLQKLKRFAGNILRLSKLPATQVVNTRNDPNIGSAKVFLTLVGSAARVKIDDLSPRMSRGALPASSDIAHLAFFWDAEREKMDGGNIGDRYGLIRLWPKKPVLQNGPAV